MTQNDIFWFFLMKTALNDNVSLVTLYDKNKNFLLRLKKEENTFIPQYRYQENCNNEKGIEMISQYLNKNPSISVVDNINRNDRMVFLQDFFRDVAEDKIAKEITEKLNYKNLEEGDKIIVRIDYGLFLKYQEKLHCFLKEKYNSSYFPLGITENTEIL